MDKHPPSLMKNTALILHVIILLGALCLLQGCQAGASESGQMITSEVKQGPFNIYVNATGELKAKRSVKIRGPQGMRSVGIWQTAISDLIPEGSMVKKGDFVASLDKSELATKMQELQSEIEKIETQLAQSKIDTAIEMKEIRDEIANLEFSMQQEELEIEKNRFEPEMIIEQSKLKLQKSERDYAQLQEKLKLKEIQSEAKIGEHDAELRQKRIRMNQYETVAQQFTVTAPEDGMLIYDRNWNGSKKGPGSTVSAWDPVVAELPDLSDFISVIYVNEVDISKLKDGQDVKIQVDAFPEKTFEGYVSAVANIGQQLRNQDAKVFEVTVQLNQVDSILRPAMTTSNEVLVYAYEDVLSVPLEAYQKTDSLEFVVKKVGNKFLKQQVIADASNDDEIIIAAGLSSEDIVCLTTPDNLPELDLVPLDDQIIQQTRDRLKEVSAERAAKESELSKRAKGELASQRESSGSGVLIIN